MSQEQEKKYRQPKDVYLYYSYDGYLCEPVSLQTLLDRHKEWINAMPRNIHDILTSNDILAKNPPRINPNYEYFNSHNRLNITFFNEKDLSWILLSTREDAYLTLMGANLREVIFNNAILSCLNFEGALLYHADFSNAVLTLSKFCSAGLSETIFEKATLERATFDNVESEKINFRGADLKGASFKSAKLQSADFTKAILSSSDMPFGDFTEVNFESANLSKAVFVGADLTDAILRNVDLTGANLSQTILERADLSGADLRDANLSGANLKNAILSDVKINQRTIDLSQNIKTKFGGIAVNGIWAFREQMNKDEEENAKENGIAYRKPYDSVAFLPLNPKADSKYGRNADVVVENLKHAQHLTGVYLTMVGVAFINLLVKRQFIDGSKLNNVPMIGTFLSLDVPLIFGLSFLMMVVLMMIGLPLKKAYEGAKYLRTREEISKVGNFAWTMTQYIGINPLPKHMVDIDKEFLEISRKIKIIQILNIKFLASHNIIINIKYIFIIAYNQPSWCWEWLISKSVRLAMIFSGPLVLLGLYYAKYVPQLSWKGLQFVWMFPLVLFYYWMPIIILGGLSIWLFRLTERFQKPLVFDPRQEHEDAEKAQKAKIDAENEQKLRMEAYQAMIDLAKNAEPPS